MKLKSIAPATDQSAQVASTFTPQINIQVSPGMDADQVANAVNAAMATNSEVIDSFQLTENEDGSVSFPLVDGTIVTLRDLLNGDVIKLEQFVLQFDGKAGNSAVAMKLTSVLCIGWGDAKGISYDELMQIPLRKFSPNLKRLNKVFEFFRIEDLLSGVGSDL